MVWPTLSFSIKATLAAIAVTVPFLVLAMHGRSSPPPPTPTPSLIVTWNFTSARDAAWSSLLSTLSALEAVESGCRKCQELQCDGTVGFGGSPDENGQTTLDALIMDGDTLNLGAVGALEGVRDAVGVARAVLEHTHHSFLVGAMAAEFAVQMGFEREHTATNASRDIWRRWKRDNCQPNFWKNVMPDPSQSCGPYSPAEKPRSKSSFAAKEDHDTIGIVAIDQKGSMAAATSTNGASHKIPGRIGDSPIAGAGAYVDSEMGGAAATGDGDLMLRALPSFVAVEALRSGHSASSAASKAIERVRSKFPSFNGGVVVLSKRGEFGAACHGFDAFPFAVAFIGDDGHAQLATHVMQCSQNEA